jgi:hypothetical protein
MALLNQYTPPPRRSKPDHWIQNLLGNTLTPAVSTVTVFREPLFTRIAKKSALVATLFVAANLTPLYTPSNAYVLSADPGGYSVSGVNADISEAKILNADVGGYSVGGITADIRVAKLLNADLGAYSINGANADIAYAPLPKVARELPPPRPIRQQRPTQFPNNNLLETTLQQLNSYTLNADIGIYSIGGVNADIVYVPIGTAPFKQTQWPNFQRGVADVRVYGWAVRLPSTVTHILNAEPGSYGISGVDANIVYSSTPAIVRVPLVTRIGARRTPVHFWTNNLLEYTLASAPGAYIINAGTGAYATAGVDAQILKTNLLNANPGSYSTSGVNAAILAARILNASAGGYAQSGVDASVLAARLLNAGISAYAINGLDADIVYVQAGHYILDVLPGSYSMSGVDAQVLAARIVATLPGSYSVSGIDAQILKAKLLNVAPGTYLITGADALIVANKILNALPESYVVTGFNVGDPGGGAPPTVSGREDTITVIIITDWVR